MTNPKPKSSALPKTSKRCCIKAKLVRWGKGKRYTSWHCPEHHGTTV